MSPARTERIRETSERNEIATRVPELSNNGSVDERLIVYLDRGLVLRHGGPQRLGRPFDARRAPTSAIVLK
jgi:hypothetical protein